MSEFDPEVYGYDPSPPSATSPTLGAPRISEAVLALAAAAYRLGAELDDPIPDIAVRKQYLGEIVRAEEALSTEDRLLLSRIAPPPLTPKPDLVELVKRVRKAENTLLREMEQSVEKERKAHLRSKAEGVRLVLSYIVEMTRG